MNDMIKSDTALDRIRAITQIKLSVADINRAIYDDQLSHLARAKLGVHRWNNWAIWVFNHTYKYMVPIGEGGYDPFSNGMRFINCTDDSVFFPPPMIDFTADIKTENSNDEDTLVITYSDFRGFFFPASVSFEGLEFNGRVIFDGAIFSDWVNFNSATFNGNTNFMKTIFYDLANFKWAKFNSGNVNSLRALSKVSFFCAKFNSMTNFTEANFSIIADFMGATFKNSVDFSKSVFADSSNFTGVEFQSSVNLDRVNFGDKDLSVLNINLDYVKFGDKGIFDPNRDYIPDFRQTTFTLLPNLDYVYILDAPSNQYPDNAMHKIRTLRSMAIEAHNHLGEKRFFRHELLARRQNTPDRLASVMISAYELSCECGLSIGRPLLWLLVTWAVFTVLYLSVSNWSVAEIWHYDYGASLIHFSMLNSLPIFGLGKSLTSDTANLLFQGDSSILFFLTLVHNILAIVFSFLFFLALRTHFKIK